MPIGTNNRKIPGCGAHHIAIQAQDWDASLRLYRDVLGMPVVAEFDYTDPSVRSQLWQQIGEHRGPASRAVYLTHLVHRQVDWSIRRHAPATIKRWLMIATTVLGDLTTCS